MFRKLHNCRDVFALSSFWKLKNPLKRLHLKKCYIGLGCWSLKNITDVKKYHCLFRTFIHSVSFFLDTWHFMTHLVAVKLTLTIQMHWKITRLFFFCAQDDNTKEPLSLFSLETTYTQCNPPESPHVNRNSQSSRSSSAASQFPFKDTLKQTIYRVNKVLLLQLKRLFFVRKNKGPVLMTVSESAQPNGAFKWISVICSACNSQCC